MIRPVNDFRIGNLVLDEDGELCKIEQLSSEKMECFQQVSNIENKSCISTKYPSNIYAIELTEEWLIKAGLEKTKDYYISTKPEMYKGFRFNLRVLANEYTFCYEGYFKKIEFVHQLQNLFFELTGSELDF